MNTVNFPGRISTIASDEVLALASQIYDALTGKNVSAAIQHVFTLIGQEVTRALAAETASVDYDQETNILKFKNSEGTVLYQFDASRFVIDGMIDNVEVKDVTISGDSVKCIVFTFNTDAGKQDINIPITLIFDPSLYYTKTQTDTLLLPITNAIASGYIYKGLATTSTVPETLSAKSFYIAVDAGTYTNFTNNNQAITIASKGFYILKASADGAWTKDTVLEFDTQITQNSTNPILSGALYPMLTLLNSNLVYSGIATPSQNPGTVDHVFYFALQGGIYTNFVDSNNQSIVVNKGLSILSKASSSDAWTKQEIYKDDDFINTNRAQALTSDQQTEAQNNMMAKSYAPAQFSGLGKKILAKNIQQVGGVDKNVMTQAFFEDAQSNQLTNTVFVIQYDYILGENITIPAGCTLQFDGGSISGNGNYYLNGDNTVINTDCIKIFDTELFLGGTWEISEVYPEWFGAKGDGVTNDTAAINKAIEFASDTNIANVVLLGKQYLVSTIYLKNNMSFGGIPTTNSALWNDSLTKIKSTSSVVVSVNPDVLERNTIYNLNIHDIAVESEYSGIGIGYQGNGLKGLQRCKFTNLHCRNNVYGIYFNIVDHYGISYCEFNNVNCTHNNYGMMLEGVKKDSNLYMWINLNTFKTCNFSSNKYGGIYIKHADSTEDNMFDTCAIEKNGITSDTVEGFGVKLEDCNISGFISFINCYFESNRSLLCTALNYDYKKCGEIIVDNAGVILNNNIISQCVSIVNLVNGGRVITSNNDIKNLITVESDEEIVLLLARGYVNIYDVNYDYSNYTLIDVNEPKYIDANIVRPYTVSNSNLTLAEITVSTPNYNISYSKKNYGQDSLLHINSNTGNSNNLGFTSDDALASLDDLKKIVGRYSQTRLYVYIHGTMNVAGSTELNNIKATIINVDAQSLVIKRAAMNNITLYNSDITFFGMTIDLDIEYNTYTDTDYCFKGTNSELTFKSCNILTHLDPNDELSINLCDFAPTILNCTRNNLGLPIYPILSIGDIKEDNLNLFKLPTTRPTLPVTAKGFSMFENNKPIYWTGTGWVDATGATV